MMIGLIAGSAATSLADHHRFEYRLGRPHSVSGSLNGAPACTGSGSTDLAAGTGSGSSRVASA